MKRLRDCDTQAERVAIAIATPAEVIKARLVAFLEWPTNAGPRLLYEWGEVVEELLDETPESVDEMGDRDECA